VTPFLMLVTVNGQIGLFISSECLEFKICFLLGVIGRILEGKFLEGLSEVIGRKCFLCDPFSHCVFSHFAHMCSFLDVPTIVPLGVHRSTRGA